MNIYKVVRQLTGYRIRLGFGESIADFKQTDRFLSVKINRVRGHDSGYRGRDFTITHRGVTLYTWALLNGSWQAIEPVTVWWSTDELLTASMPRQRDLEWERMGLVN